MSNLITKAKELLESKTVGVIIGYQNGSAGNVRAAFIKDPAEADKLVYDERCRQNLAVYLMKHEVKHAGKPCIVANLNTLRSILMIASENQLIQDNLVVVGVDESGNVLDFKDFASIEQYVATKDLSLPAKDREVIENLKAMTMQERWDFWQKELSRCFKCYACRQSCPMCYCVRCTVEANQPQWIPVAPHNIGNFEWHMMRAMHLAGRCVGCRECGTACPLEIPVHLLTMYISDVVKTEFDVVAGTSATLSSALSTYLPNDKENFIV